jgi:D-methionine transport system permease protein
MLNEFTIEVIQATGETAYMIFISTIGAILLGWPLGTFVFMSQSLSHKHLLARIINAIINTSRSIPFIIFMVALIPFTRWLIGSAIGIHAAIIPLTLGATPLFARLTIQAYEQISKGIIEYGFSIGATPMQMIRWMLRQEITPMFVDAVTMTAITLVSYSAMAGVLGGGGLGDLAIRYGYQRFDTFTMLLTTAILIVMVHGIQWLGDHIRKRFQHHI